MNSVPLPWFVKMSLAVVSLLALPSYVGLATKTKAWCAITGKCEIGGASYGDLTITAIFATLLVAVFYYVVVCRKTALIALAGGTQLLAFVLMSFFFSLNALELNQFPTLIDGMLLCAMLFIGLSLTAFAMRLFRPPVPTVLEVRLAEPPPTGR